MRRGRRGRRHHAGRAAVIELRAGLRLAQQCGDVEPARRVAAIVVEDDMPLRGEQVQFVAERGPLRRPGAVIEPEIRAPALQFGDHRHDRGDADAAGQQQIALRRLGQREMVAGQRGLDDLANPQPVVQMARTLAFPQYRDAIAPPLGRVVPQRIVAPHALGRAVAEPHPDMRAGGKARQVAPVRIDQLVAVDLLGQIGDRADAQLHASLSAQRRRMQSAFG